MSNVQSTVNAETGEFACGSSPDDIWGDGLSRAEAIREMAYDPNPTEVILWRQTPGGGPFQVVADQPAGWHCDGCNNPLIIREWAEGEFCWDIADITERQRVSDGPDGVCCYCETGRHEARENLR